MSLDKHVKRTVTFRRVHGAEADRLIRRGWLRMGSYQAADYDSHLMAHRERDDGPGGEDGHGGE